MAKTNREKMPMGSTAKDTITGFTGIICAYVEYITGCDNVGLRPITLKADGSPKDSQYFDVTRIKIIAPPTKEVERVVKGKMQVKGRTKKQKGGPQHKPRRSQD